MSDSERASFLLRTLSGPRAGGATAGTGSAGKASFYGQLVRRVVENPVFATTRSTSALAWQWAGTISWVLGTSLMVLIFPLWVEIGRELDMGQLEQDIMLGYQARGYPPQQLQMMQQQGQFGIPPMPPPAQPQFE